MVTNFNCILLSIVYENIAGAVEAATTDVVAITTKHQGANIKDYNFSTVVEIVLDTKDVIPHPRFVTTHNWNYESEILFNRCVL